MKTKILAAAMAVGMGIVGVSESASALTITRNFISVGNSFGGALGNATVAPTLFGGGNLTSVFDAAADWWEAAISDPFNLSINYGWQGRTSPTLATHNLLTQAGGRETSGAIRFDSDGSTVWFADPTPHDNSEYTTFTATDADLGGGSMNVGRVYTGATGFAMGRFDLLSVAKHEIGHALGLSSANLAYQNEAWPDNDIDVTGILFNGAVIPTNNGNTPETGATSNAHININTALMFPSFSSGMRKVQSDVDILANCQISQFRNCNLDPAHSVAEPGTLALFGLGLAGLGFARRKRAA